MGFIKDFGGGGTDIGTTSGILKADGAGNVSAAVAGTDYQAPDADLTSWAAVTRASGFDTFTATPTSANLAALVTNETGSSLLVFNTSPVLVTPTVTTSLIGTSTLSIGTGSGDLTLAPTGNTTTAKKVLITENTASGSVGTGSLIVTGGISASQQCVFQIAQVNAQVIIGSNSNNVLLYCQSSNKLQILDGGFTGTGMLIFGPLTTSFPALKRNGTVLEARLGDDSGYTAFKSSYLQASTFTVATLPAAATAGAGARAVVTDALAPAFGSAVAGSGAVTVPVYSTGSAWNVG